MSCWRKYVDLRRYGRRVGHVINQTMLSPLESALVREAGCLSTHPPIFIIGPPRSGSTLLAQVLVTAFEFGYLSNRHCRFFGAPVAAERWFRPLSPRQPSNFRSTHGVGEGPSAISECGAFWYRFFRRDPAHVSIDETPAGEMGRFRATLDALTRLQGKPLLFKNLFATLRLRPLAHHLPEARFIVSRRNEVENAYSILEGRMKDNGEYQTWWSVPVPEVATLQDFPAAAQAVEQVRRLHALVERDIVEGGLDRARFLTVDYESLCSDVHSEVERVAAFLARTGACPARKYDVPVTFCSSRYLGAKNGAFADVAPYAAEAPRHGVGR